MLLGGESECLDLPETPNFWRVVVSLARSRITMRGGYALSPPATLPRVLSSPPMPGTTPSYY